MNRVRASSCSIPAHDRASGRHRERASERAGPFRSPAHQRASPSSFGLACANSSLRFRTCPPAAPLPSVAPSSRASRRSGSSDSRRASADVVRGEAARERRPGRFARGRGVGRGTLDDSRKPRGVHHPRRRRGEGGAQPTELRGRLEAAAGGARRRAGGLRDPGRGRAPTSTDRRARRLARGRRLSRALASVPRGDARRGRRRPQEPEPAREENHEGGANGGRRDRGLRRGAARARRATLGRERRRARRGRRRGILDAGFFRGGILGILDASDEPGVVPRLLPRGILEEGDGRSARETALVVETGETVRARPRA